MVPDKNSIVPDWKPCVPKKIQAVPDNKSFVPVKILNVSKKNPTVPDGKPCVPVKNSTVPDEKACVPEKISSVPVKNPIVPVEKPCVPKINRTVPEKKPSVPDKKGSVPAKYRSFHTKSPLYQSASIRKFISLQSHAIEEIQNLMLNVELEEGDTQQQTVVRDEKLNELEDWTSIYKKVAWLMFENDPQYLEKLGILVKR